MPDPTAPDGPDATVSSSPDDTTSHSEIYEEAPPRLTDDPVVRRILRLAVGLVILFLATVVSALFFGLLNPSSPRTATERALNVYESAVEAGNANPAVYAAYTRALTEAGQYNRAQEVLNASQDATGTAKATLQVEQARLDLARDDYEDAIKSADVAIMQFAADRKKLEEVYKERGMPTPEDRPVEHRYALIIKAEAFAKLDRADDAIKVYSEYLKIWPVDSDVLTLRGDLYADTGDKGSAEKDYRAALQFVPDYEPALEGLDKIGAKR